METVTYNGVQYAPIDLPKVGEKVLIKTAHGYEESKIRYYASMAIADHNNEIVGIDRVLRIVDPQVQPQPPAPAPLTAEQQVWLTVYAAAVQSGKVVTGLENVADGAVKRFNERFNPQPVRPVSPELANLEKTLMQFPQP